MFLQHVGTARGLCFLLVTASAQTQVHDAGLQVRSITDVLSLGQQIQVKVMGHDAKGQLQVSHKALTAPGGATGVEEAATYTELDAETAQSQRHSRGDEHRHQRRFKPRIPRS